MENKTTTMKNQNYKIEFFDGRTYEWKPVRCYKHLANLDEAKAFKKAQQELCNYMVDFRIVEEVA